MAASQNPDDRATSNAKSSRNAISDNNSRQGLFDVLARHSGRILLAFYAIWAILAGLLTCVRILTAENPPLTWPEIVIITIIAAAVTVGIAFPLAFGTMEGIPMVLAEIRKRLWREEALAEGREQGHEEGREEGRQEGRQEATREVHQSWEAWNQRRLAAERAGRTFTEPPPSHHGTQNNNAD